MTKQSDDNIPREELLKEIEQLRGRLDEADQTLEAIRCGDVDALVVAGPQGDQIFSLSGAESIYRLIYETMNEAALTVALDGTILFCNRRFCELMKSPMEDCVGSRLSRFVAPAQQQPLKKLLVDATTGPFLRHISLRAADGSSVSTQIAVSTIVNDADISICLLATDLTELELQAGSIASMIKQQQDLEEKQAELKEVNASLRNSRLAALNLMQDAVEARNRLEESTHSLQNSEKRIQQALDVSRSFTFDWLPVTDLVIRSASCAAILKLSGDEAVNDTGYHFFQSIHPDDRARFGQILRDLKPTANTYLTEYRYVCKDGSEITLEETGQATFDAAGKMLRLVGVSTDITTRIQAEENLRNVNAKLELRIEERTSDLAEAVKNLEEEIHERLRAELNLHRLNRLYAVLSETNQTIVKCFDRDSLFRDFCHIAVKHGGFVLSWIGLVDEQNSIVNVVASSSTNASLNDIQIFAVNETGEEGPSEISVREGSYYICNDFQNDLCTRPWHDQAKKYGIYASASIAIKENDRVIGALALYGGEKDYFDDQQVELLLQMGMDISFALDNLNRENKRKEAESAFYRENIERLKAVETLREKEQMLIQQSRQAAMGEMIGNIAHQWRQPLNTLGLFTQRLGFFYGQPTFNKEFLDSTVAKSMEIIQHMSKTIDDFRNYFKPEKKMCNFNVSDAITSTLSLLEGSFQNPKIDVVVVENENSVIHGFQNEFAQVLLNILANARDVIIEREIVDAKVTITTYMENGCCVITIADNAGGIPEGIIEKVFDPYFSTKGPQQGTGVGLFMSKSIIEKNMGGTLVVRNTGVGAEFKIEVGCEPPN